MTKERMRVVMPMGGRQVKGTTRAAGVKSGTTEYWLDKVLKDSTERAAMPPAADMWKLIKECSNYREARILCRMFVAKWEKRKGKK